MARGRHRRRPTPASLDEDRLAIEALSDIDRIADRIAADNPEAAARIFSRIRQTTEGLQLLPHSGRPGRKIDTREVVVSGSPYVVVYRIEADTIEILRVLHGRQSWPDTDP